MQPSPYTPGSIATSVPGRHQQIAEFDERLSYLVDLQRLVGRIRVDHAPRGLGKTSLMREYQRRARERGVVTVWVTAGEESGLITQIAAGIRAETRSWRSEAKSNLQHVLDRLSVSVSLLGVVRLETAADAERAKSSPVGVREFEDVIRATASANEQAGLIIFIDEIQAADAAGLRTLAYAWQHLQSEGVDVPAAVFAAGLPDAADKISSVVTFTERMAFRPLELLVPDAERMAIVTPARALGVSWEDEALNQSIDIARGYPYSLQLIADASWSAAGRPDHGDVITSAHVRQGRETMRADLYALFRARWSNATPQEQKFMTAMARFGDESVRRADIAGILDVSSRSVSVARARLIDKGFIRVPERGELAFTVPGFAAFIREIDDR